MGERLPLRTWLLLIIAIVVVVAALRATYVVLMPLTAAFYLAMLVHPLQRWLRLHLPRSLGILSLLLSFLAVLLVLAIGVALIYIAIQAVIDRAPQFGEQLQAYMARLQTWLGARGIRLRGGGFSAEGTFGHLANVATVLVSSASSVLGMLMLVFFFAVLMLAELVQWRAKAALALVGPRSRAMVQTIEDISQKVRLYLLTQTLISAVSGLLEGTYLYIVGVEFAFMWGLLFFLLNYIPNIGSLAVAAGVSLTALIQFGLWRGLLVMSGIIVLEQVIGNLVGPRIQGRSLRVSPLVLLWSIIFWSWVWGIAGALLATPLAVTIVMICEHVKPLHPLAMLLHERVAPEDYKLQPNNVAAKPESSHDGGTKTDESADSPGPEPPSAPWPA